MIFDAQFEEVNQTLNADFGVVSAINTGGGIVDQIYNPESENAQSGKAVAEAIATIENTTQYKGKLPKGAEILDGYYSGSGAFVSSTTISTIKIPVVDNQVLFVKSMHRNSMDGITTALQMRALGEDLSVKAIATHYNTLYSNLLSVNGEDTHVGFLMYILPDWGAKYIIFTMLTQYVNDCIVLDKTNFNAYDNTIFTESGYPLYPKNLNSNKLVGKGYISPSTKLFNVTTTIETYGLYKLPTDTVINTTLGTGTGTFGMVIDADFVFVQSVGSTQYQTTQDCYLIVVDQCYGGEVHASFEIENNKLNNSIPQSAIETGFLKGKKWASLGDSITYQEKWQPYVADMIGLVQTNCGIGSTYLAGNSSSAFWQDSRLNTVKNANPDFVTILGGANDLTVPNPIGTEAEFTKALADKDKTTFIGAYSYIIENLLTWKPTLQIIILGTTWAHNDGLSLDKGMTYTEYSDACKKVAEYYGLPFVDLHANLGFNKFTMGASPYNIYSNDYIHPNELGGKKIASMVIAKIKEIYSV